MGMYRLEIEAVGGHGCNREIKDGGTTYGCGHRACPDCEVRALIDQLRAKGSSVSKAVLTHWPDTPQTVVDDLLTGVRKGSF